MHGLPEKNVVYLGTVFRDLCSLPEIWKAVPLSAYLRTDMRSPRWQRFTGRRA